MNQNGTILSAFAKLVLITIVCFALVIFLTTFRGADPGSLDSTLGSTPRVINSFTPDPEGTLSEAAIVTLKAVGEATYLAITRTPETPIYLPTGIYDDQRVKISAALLFIDAQNAWAGIIDGYRFTLYAGALQSDPNQGVVGLVNSLPNGKRFSQFETPSRHGAIHVVNELNNRIELISSDGTIFYFDLPTYQFVTSLTEVAPSVTPSPEVTPTPTGPPYPPPITPETAIP